MGSGFALDMFRRFKHNAAELRSKRRSFENKHELEERFGHDYHPLKKKYLSNSARIQILKRIHDRAIADQKKEIRRMVFSVILAGIIIAVLIMLGDYLYELLKEYFKEPETYIK